MASTTPSRPLAASQRLLIRSRLLSLPFAAFARCLSDLLTALGYQDVRPSSRTQWKGRNQAGGYDIEATLPSGLGHRRVVVQVKQFTPEQRVYQRTVDELRGVALREWAGEALLLTTGPVSSAIREPSGVMVPVRLLGGDALLDALARCGVGVREANGALTVDDAYFDRLAGPSSMVRPADRRASGKAPAPAETLTLVLTLPVIRTALPHTRVKG